MAADQLTEIHLFSPGFEEFFVRYAQQIGQGEVFVETEDHLPQGSRVILIFQIVYEDLELVRARGAVSSVVDKEVKGNSPPKSGNSSNTPGMVVKIDEIDYPFKAYLMELIKRQIRSDLSKMFTT